EYKSYFEMKVRSLGVDETIYGDVDSIAKNVKYLADNNFLREAKYINFNNTKPFWEAKIPALLKDYLEEKPEEMLNLFCGFKIIDSHLNFKIKEHKDEHYNFKIITGCLDFHLRPNFEKEEQPILKNIFYSDYDTVVKFFRDLKLTVDNVQRRCLHQDVKLKLYTNNYNENHLSIVKCEIIPSPDISEFVSYFNSEFTLVEDRMEYLLKQMVSNDIVLLKSTIKGSEVYNQLLLKYRNKIKS